MDMKFYRDCDKNIAVDALATAVGAVWKNSGTQSGSGTALEVLWMHSGSTLKLALWTGLLLAPTCRMVRHPVGLRIH